MGNNVDVENVYKVDLMGTANGLGVCFERKELKGCSGFLLLLFCFLV